MTDIRPEGSARPRLVLFAAGLTEQGGVQRRASLIARGFVERGWEVRVLSRAGTARRFRVNREAGLTIFEVPGFSRRRLGAALFALCALPVGLWWSRRAAGLLAIQLTAPASIGGICSLVSGRPLIALSSISGMLSDARHADSSGLRRLLLSRAAFLVAQTEEGAAELAGIADANRIAIVPNPVEPLRPPPLTGDHTALFSGRLAQEKDLPRLLEVWASLMREIPDATLLLAGSGGDHRSIEPMLRRRVADDPALRKSVRFLGWVADLTPVFARTDVYVFPSLSEGMSNALLEACTAGRVIVASDIAPNRAVLGNDYPLLFTAGDSDGLLAALRGAFLDQDLRRRAVAHIGARMPLFAPERVVGRLEELVLRASDRHRSVPAD